MFTGVRRALGRRLTERTITIITKFQVDARRAAKWRVQLLHKLPHPPPLPEACRALFLPPRSPCQPVIVAFMDPQLTDSLLGANDWLTSSYLEPKGLD